MPDAKLGVFTSIGIKDGKAILLNRHVERLQKSCHELYQQELPTTFSEEAQAWAQTMSDNERLRIDIKPTNMDVRVSMSRGLVPQSPRAIEVAVMPSGDWNYGHKWSDRSTLPDKPTLLLDDNQNVLELTIANVFAVIDNQLVTPPLNGRILPGVARSWVIDNYEVSEAAISISQLLNADEMLATNAVRGVIPVARCDYRTWNDVGPRTSELLERWQGRVQA